MVNRFIIHKCTQTDVIKKNNSSALNHFPHFHYIIHHKGLAEAHPQACYNSYQENTCKFI